MVAWSCVSDRKGRFPRDTHAFWLIPGVCRGNYVMLGPDALSAENAEATLASLDRMSNMPSKQPAAAPKPAAAAASSSQYQQESSYESDVLGLSRIVEDASRMQRRPQQSAYHAVHDAAKGVMFDLEDGPRRVLPTDGGICACVTS